MDRSREIAEKLLDAQVEYLIGELSGDRFAEVVARDVPAVLAVADGIVFRDVVTPDQAKAALRKAVDRAGAAPIVGVLTPALAESLYDRVAATQDRLLSTVVDRAKVDVLVQKLLGLHTAHERLLDRLSEAAEAGPVASTFVDRLVDDILEANKKIAGKVPGVGSLMSLGQSAVKTAKKAADNSFLGDAAGKGTMYGLKRVTNALRETLRVAPVHVAAMQVWDVHAAEPVAGLRAYLTQADVRDFAVMIQDLIVSTRNKEFTGILLDDAVDVFFARYGDHTLGELVTELGADRDDIAEEILRFGPAVIEAAKADGVLAKLIRERLEPFYLGEGALGILSAS
ncbi:hypothetical protein [Nocardia stercoris]|uniref:Uncharacterized protein n=1 Tax=Nocardia stercoris TaxID=2483361 RepID=A0A3M2KWE4_9NOCA|nr:hypothetical protein [Nocardia stercoris]RMI29892.1 hypothetical protein EBN03_24170 [Nocardia stercoris]